MYLFDAHIEVRSEELLHSQSNKVKQSLLIDQWQIVFENLINLTQLLPVEYQTTLSLEQILEGSQHLSLHFPVIPLHHPLHTKIQCLDLTPFNLSAKHLVPYSLKCQINAS